MTVSKAEPKKVEKKGISIAAAKKLEQVEMEIARQEATVKMYTFRMNSEPEIMPPLRKSIRTRKKSWQNFMNDGMPSQKICKGGLHERHGTGGSQGND